METLNQRISKIIEYSKLTASEFADEIEVPRSSISHIASGRNKPSLDFLVKVKDHFPELQWDWIISGKGEMLKNITAPEEVQEKSAPTSLPDLFSMISDENFGKTEAEAQIQVANSPELNKTEQPPASREISDSQQLDNDNNKSFIQPIENQKDKIKKIVMFFENGKFESFEP